MRKTLDCIVLGNPAVSGVVRQASGTQFTASLPQGDAELYIYKGMEDKPFRVIPLPDEERIGSVSSVLINLPENEVYTYLYKTENGYHIDPYAEGICPVKHDGEIQWRGMVSPEKSVHSHSVHLHFEDMILYKLHVRGFTKNRKGMKAQPGTFAGVRDTIPYLKDLGINAVLLMPAYEFDEGKGSRKNYWGYAGGYYFAPKYSYSASGNPALEFAEMTDSLHEAGIACLLEFSFGEREDARLVTDVLRHWVMQYHVDGFRLAGEGPWLSAVSKDPLLTKTKILLSYVEENAFPVKTQPDRSKAVYNTEYRDTMRRFLKGDPEISSEAVSWMLRRNGVTYSYISYFNDQDGFTLADMVAYEERHNEENGEDNRDGNSYNFTWNCGEEGPSRKASVCRLRDKQIRNALLILMTTQSTPMLYAGDEMLNTQNGNNNAWCQDNMTGWTDWKRSKAAAELHDFVKKLIAFRNQHPILRLSEPLRLVDYKACGFPDISYHSHAAWLLESRQLKAALGVLYCGKYAVKTDGTQDDTLYIIYNMYWQKQYFALPEPPAGTSWVLKADTEYGPVFYPEGEEPAIIEDENKQIPAEPRSIRILLAKKAGI